MQKYVAYLKTFKKYSYLLTLLVKKDLKKKYKGSVLGILWSLLNPLLNMIVITIVFSTLFKNKVENFPVYLLCGFLLFSFFNASTSTSMKSVIASAYLIRKVSIPKYIMTLANTLSNFIFFVISLLDLVLIILITKAEITLNIIYAPLYLVLLFFFCCGLSFILATITVFFRDIEHLYGVLVTAIMYASAIFYPTDIIPEKFQFILTFNPVHYFISGFRDVVYLGVPIDINNLLICMAIAAVSMFVGIIVFEKNQDKFIFYV